MDFQALTIRAASHDEVRPFVLLASRFDTSGGNTNIDRLIRNGEPFVFEQGGEVVAGFVLQRNGKEIHVTSMAGKSDIDLTKAVLDVVEKNKLAEVETIGFTTKRKGLVKKAQSLGYEIDGYIMRKKIKK